MQVFPSTTRAAGRTEEVGEKTSDGRIAPAAGPFTTMKCGGRVSLFPPFLLLDEGEVFFDGVLPLLQVFIGEQMLI